MSLTFLLLPNYREAEIRIHFKWNRSLALDHSSPKCSCYTLIWLQLGVPNLQLRDSSYWLRKGLAINPNVQHSHKAIRPGYVCSMGPTFHCRFTVPGSITTTTSPTRKLSLRKYHFYLDPICGKYSFIHRFHKCLVSSFSLLQRFLGLNGSVLTLSGTKSPPVCPIRKWFEVKTRPSLGSSLTAVKGLEFSRLSTPIKIVSNSSSLTSA